MTLAYHAIMDGLARDADKHAVRFRMASEVRAPSPAEHGVAKDLLRAMARVEGLLDELDEMQADVRMPCGYRRENVMPNEHVPSVCECGYRIDQHQATT